MGAGYRFGGTASGGRKAGEALAQKRGEPELRHEYADDEQRIRHGDVAQRRIGLTRRA